MRPLVLVWDNFGPLHRDRLEAVAAHLGDVRRVVGLELCGRSDTYGWTGANAAPEIRTLFPERDLAGLGTGPLLAALIRAARGLGRGDWLLCHWNLPAIALFAASLRLAGARPFAMGCSKFDDKPRRAGREALKSLMFAPYRGGLAGGRRSVDYLAFHSVAPVAEGYNTVSQARLRRLAGVAPAPGGPPHAARGFLCVARLVAKKNLATLLEAYALYRAADPRPRPLTLCGDGPEAAALQAQARALGIAAHVRFTGFLQTEAVAAEMGRALALLLPSAEEQFGNVVPEAQALGLPVIVSDAVGARDRLVRTGVNGFVVEPDNPRGLALFMGWLAQDPTLWAAQAEAARATPGGDVAAFARGVARLIGEPA